ncbi:MAG: hypothetical protein K0R14_1580 [Burkholderiales bacterium]|nr:hypothetical protein [Burkholderiales bacterium]
MPAYINVILYMVLTAISFTFIDKLGNVVNPLISLFFMSIYATIWFNAVNYKHLKQIYLKCCSQNRLLYIIVAINVGINWLCSIFAPHKSDPFIYLSVTFVTMAICGLVATQKETKTQFFIEWGCIMLLASSVVLLRYGYEIHYNKNTDTGLILGCISGVTTYYYAVFSNKYSKENNFSSSQMLALRFWPLIIGLGCFILFRHITFTFTWHITFILLIISFLALIIPVYFLQKAIITIKTNSLSVILAITPVITFFIYSISIKKLNLTNLVVCLVITTTLCISRIIPIILSHRRKHLGVKG